MRTKLWRTIVCDLKRLNLWMKNLEKDRRLRTPLETKSDAVISRSHTARYFYITIKFS